MSAFRNAFDFSADLTKQLITLAIASPGGPSFRLPYRKRGGTTRNVRLK
jgi:hypothetical protein